MADAAELILRTLDRHLVAPGDVRLLGGAAMVLAYGLDRATEDADLLLDDAELQLLVDSAGFGEALERVNAELEPAGLYISHIWGPEQQILAPGWRERCRAVPLRFERLRASALGPLDLLTSKLCRADAGDMADIRWLLAHEHLRPEDVRRVMANAVVPDVFRDVYPANVAKVEALLHG